VYPFAKLLLTEELIEEVTGEEIRINTKDYFKIARRSVLRHPF
jgi:hypothetical protein